MTPEERAEAMQTLVNAWAGGIPERLDVSEQFVLAAIRDGGLRCRYCGLDLYFYDSYTVRDHVTPLSRGGGRGLDNVVIACKDCNGLKGVYVPAPGDLNARIADAKREIDKRRVDRIDKNLPGLLERLIREAQP